MKQTFFSLSPKKRAFLTGTLLLTGTGFLCRILGFFYRIFMSRTIGAEGLGIYNMVHPVFGYVIEKHLLFFERTKRRI